MMKSISAQEISQYLPHSGSMCLIDQVNHYDQIQIHCQTLSHRKNDNPLRMNDTLHAINSVEYAAQAAALHLALQSNGNTPTVLQGYLAAIQQCIMSVETLDDIMGPLEICCAHLFTDETAGAFYEFTVSYQQTTIVTGQFLIMFNNKGHK